MKRILFRFLAISSMLTVAGCGRLNRMSEEECLTRAMYFESNRSSQEGMLAVGTVVMNRLKSGKYPKNVCGVVGQKNQFAPGVLSKPMGKGEALAQKTARVVLRGARHPQVGRAMFFHTAGYSYPYTNMQYVAVLGGNAFYEKRKNATATQESVTPKQDRLPYSPPQREVMVAENRPAPRVFRQPAPERYDPAPARVELVLQPVDAAPAYRLPAAQPALEPVGIEDVIAAEGGFY